MRNDARLRRVNSPPQPQKPVRSIASLPRNGSARAALADARAAARLADQRHAALAEAAGLGERAFRDGQTTLAETLPRRTSLAGADADRRRMQVAVRQPYHATTKRSGSNHEACHVSVPPLGRCCRPRTAGCGAASTCPSRSRGRGTSTRQRRSACDRAFRHFRARRRPRSGCAPWLYLDRYASAEPIDNAEIAATLDGQPVPVTRSAEATYIVSHPLLGQAGVRSLIFTITAGSDVDLLPFEIEVPAVVAAAAAAPGWRETAMRAAVEPVVWAAGLALLLLGVLVGRVAAPRSLPPVVAADTVPLKPRVDPAWKHRTRPLPVACRRGQQLPHGSASGARSPAGPGAAIGPAAPPAGRQRLRPEADAATAGRARGDRRRARGARLSATRRPGDRRSECVRARSGAPGRPGGIAGGGVSRPGQPRRARANPGLRGSGARGAGAQRGAGDPRRARFQIGIAAATDPASCGPGGQRLHTRDCRSTRGTGRAARPSGSGGRRLNGRQAVQATASGFISVAAAVGGQIVDAREPSSTSSIRPGSGWRRSPSMAAVGRVTGASATLGGRALDLAFIGRGLTVRQQAVPVNFRVVNPPAGRADGTPVPSWCRRTARAAGIVLPADAVVRSAEGPPVVFEMRRPSASCRARCASSRWTARAWSSRPGSRPGGAW